VREGLESPSKSMREREERRERESRESMRVCERDREERGEREDEREERGERKERGETECMRVYATEDTERWGARVETQKNVLRVFGGWGRVPFNEPYAPSLSTIYDGA